LTDSVFTCTTGGIASYLASFGYDVWRYRYNAAFPTTTLFANSGVYHTSEIPEVFGTYPVANQYGVATTQQIQLSKYMQHTWANFAKGTAPNWPRIGSALGFELGELGLDGSSGEKTSNVLTADYPCAFYAAIDDILQVSW
jgi:carboxylesterase 2